MWLNVIVILFKINLNTFVKVNKLIQKIVYMTTDLDFAETAKRDILIIMINVYRHALKSIFLMKIYKITLYVNLATVFAKIVLAI